MGGMCLPWMLYLGVGGCSDLGCMTLEWVGVVAWDVES